MTLISNPANILDSLLREFAKKQGLELADDYEVRVEKMRAICDEPVEVSPHELNPK